MRKCILFLVILVSFFISSCDKSETIYRVGVDPTFFPLPLLGKEENLFAFSQELLQLIGKKEGLLFVRVPKSWDNVIYSLKKGEVDAILSSMVPNIIVKEEFAFSDPIVRTGPVLVVREKMVVNSWEDLKWKAVAAEGGTLGERVIESHPEVLMRVFQSLRDALSRLDFEIFDGVMVPNLVAVSYLQDLYQGRLKIAMGPFGEQGLRFVTLKGKNQVIQERFASGLLSLEKEGTLCALMVKWNLTPAQDCAIKR